MKQIQDLFYHKPTDEFLAPAKIKQIYYNISLPNKWKEEHWELLSIVPVYQADEPESKDDMHYWELNKTYDLQDGVYVQNYTEIERRPEDFQTVQGQKWNDIRASRNILLQETDWTQLLDSPLSADDKRWYAEYRQELRDITLQKDPDNIEWPVDPYKAVIAVVV